MDVFDNNLIDVSPDGKTEPVPGKESLKKEPKRKKKKKGVIVDRWNELKKALDNSKSILDLKAEQQEEPEEEQQPDEQQEQPPQEEQQPGDDQSASPAEEQEPDEQPEEGEEDDSEEEPSDEEKQQISQTLKENGYSDAEIAYVVHGHHSPEIDIVKDAKAKAAQAMSGIETGSAEAEAKQKLSHDQSMGNNELEHKKRMADLEYKKSEMDMPDPEMEKKNKQRMADLEYEMKRSQMKDNGPEKEHAKRMSDLEYESKKAEMPNPKHKQRMEDMEYESAKASMPNNEFEVEHKKKMLELEYNFEKEAKKLELEFKKKEHQQKLKLAEEGMKQKAKEGDAKHKVRLADAKKPKPKTPLKKSDVSDEVDDIDGESVEGQPYDGTMHHEDCQDPDCHGCGVDNPPYDGVSKEEEAPYWSKRGKQVQGYKNQVNDALRAQRAAKQTAAIAAKPPAIPGGVDTPSIPKVPNTLKTDSSDISNTPSFNNKAARAQQRQNRDDAAEEAHDLVAKPDSVQPTKYIDIGTRPTPATPATHPKLR